MMERKKSVWRVCSALILVVQSLAAALWWILLWTVPASRPYFRPAGAPDSVLLSFFLPDTFLFIGAALWAAHHLIKKPSAAPLPLTLHTGAALFGSLYCVMQWLMTGEAGLAALCMAPCLLIGPILLWKFSRD
jgi:hypothetical protein